MCTEECDGVGGPDEAGDTGSVTQSLEMSVSIPGQLSSCSRNTYRCDRVATIFATVCAKVDPGLTWKTGNESFPSIKPRVDRMTEMKCVQVFCKRGSEEDRVRSCEIVRDMHQTPR